MKSINAILLGLTLVALVALLFLTCGGCTLRYVGVNGDDLEASLATNYGAEMVKKPDGSMRITLDNDQATAWNSAMGVVIGYFGFDVLKAVNASNNAADIAFGDQQADVTKTLSNNETAAAIRGAELDTQRAITHDQLFAPR